MSQLLFRTAATAFSIVIVATSASAQESVQADSAAAPHASQSAAPPARSAPTIMASVVAPDVTFRPARQEVAPVVRRREAFDRPTVLMIVGGALIVTGLLISDDASTVLYIAGAGIGGYGLYLFLQSPNARHAR